MLSQNKIKLINSLDKKKYRTKHNCFVVEGEKMISDLLRSSKFKIIEIFSTDEQLENKYPTNNITIINDQELRRISFTKTPNKTLAIVELPEHTVQINFDDLCLALDNIQDPGNLGTIIRTASWFGINNIYCSKDTVDVYNPKVIQSTMSALFNVKVSYVDLSEFLDTAKAKQIPIYGTLLSGENLYNKTLTPNGVIVMGNESKGISKEINELVDQKILIPNFPENIRNTESLNVGIACAITLAEFRRRSL